MLLELALLCPKIQYLTLLYETNLTNSSLIIFLTYFQELNINKYVKRIKYM